MGKTSILKKMLAEPHDTFLPIYRDLEPIRTPEEFAWTVFQDAEHYLSRRAKLALKSRQLVSQFGGTELAGVVRVPAMQAQNWRDLLTATFDDLGDSQPDHTILFLWDEVPLMLYNVFTVSGERSAMEILDTLRALRQHHPAVRMVFTGSIGLHLVLAMLRERNYANDPTNDMQTIELRPLSTTDAALLATELLRGEAITLTDDIGAVAARITEEVDAIPFFIHHVVDQLARLVSAGTDDVVRIVQLCITDPADPWHLSYYRERLDTYYSATNRSTALLILDELAKRETLDSNELFDAIHATERSLDRETFLSALTLLHRDHYIRRNETLISFNTTLIRRFWARHRGVA